MRISDWSSDVCSSDLLRESAEQEAIRVFAANLKDLLLAAPAGPKSVLGLDPGIRTGVKVAAIDATGKVLETATVYPFEPRRDREGSINTLAALVARSEEHTSELQSLMRISYAVFCLKQKTNSTNS